MDSYLIDTNILIGAIRNEPRCLTLLVDLVASGASIGCSVVTIGELTAGMRAREQARTGQILAELDHYPLTPALAHLAGRMKNQWHAKGFALGLDDMFIAATAIAGRLTLVTTNAKHFPMPELRIHHFPAHNS